MLSLFMYIVCAHVIMPSCIIILAKSISAPCLIISMIFKLFYFRCQFIKKKATNNHGHIFIIHIMYEKVLFLRGTSSLHITLFFSFFCTKDLLKCCNICDSEDKNLLQSSTACIYIGKIGLLISRCRKYIYTSKVFFQRL